MKNREYVFLVVIAVLIATQLSTCRRAYLLEKSKEDLQLEKLATEQRFIERIKSDSTREYSQKLMIAQKDVAIKLLGEEAKRYRNIKSVVKTKVEYVTDTVFAAYTDIDTVLLGREFCSETQFDTICGKVDSLGVVIYPHVTNLGTMTTVIANEKYGFLKLKSKPVVNVSFDNPNVRITGMSNVVSKQPKPKRLAWLGSGLVLGIVGGILLMAN